MKPTKLATRADLIKGGNVRPTLFEPIRAKPNGPVRRTDLCNPVFKTPSKSKQQGFTIVELFIVIVGLAGFAAGIALLWALVHFVLKFW